MDPNEDPWATRGEVQEKSKYKKGQRESKLPLLAIIFSVLFPPAGLVLSIIALNLFKEQPEFKGKKLAVIGLIISIAILVLSVIFIILAFTVFDIYSISFQ